jgi:iron complex outermembrane receptor protein
MRSGVFLTVFTLSLATTTMLYGQDYAQEMDIVTVTANKVEENVQNVPQSITIIDAETIEEKGIKTIEDIIQEIPNMTSVPDRGIKVNFRGLNASLFTENNPIVVYIDGIPTSYKRAFSASLNNVERVEVLRGPQGTLYGKDAIGGVINIITKEPTNETTGDAGVEYGSNKYIRGVFNINTPLLENKLFFNLNGEITSNDNWVTNTYNGDDKAAKEDDKNISASLLYKATDKLSTKLVLIKEKNKNYGFKGYGIVGSSGLDNFHRDSAENTAFEMPMFEENTIDSQSLNIKYDTDHYILDAVTVHRNADVNGLYDADYTNGTYLDGSSMFNDASSEIYSQEIRISNKNVDGVRWVGGLYIDKEERNHYAYGSHAIMAGIDYSYNNYVSNIDSNTQAIFAQSMIPLGEQFELTLGGRYQRIVSFRQASVNKKN